MEKVWILRSEELPPMSECVCGTREVLELIKRIANYFDLIFQFILAIRCQKMPSRRPTPLLFFLTNKLRLRHSIEFHSLPHSIFIFFRFLARQHFSIFVSYWHH